MPIVTQKRGDTLFMVEIDSVLIERGKHRSAELTQEQIWAPWRLDYVAEEPVKKPKGCFLCHYRDDAEGDADNYVVTRGKRTIVVLNRFPYNNGHLLVAPLTHKATLQDLTTEELIECAEYLREMTSLLKKTISAEGFNVGLNLGAVAGAGLPGHLHWHIVPRWSGDTNFMPTVANVKVIPQSLRTLHDCLQTAMATQPNKDGETDVD